MDKLETSQDFKVVKIRKGQGREEHSLVATEVPFTIVANDVEVATLMCTPSNLRELTIGFLFTSGFISGIDELKAYTLDEQTWRADVMLERTPDPAILAKRLYTSGCGKGVMYSNVAEITSRHPLKDGFTVKAQCIPKIMHWLLTSSDLHRTTGGVHSAALSLNGKIPSHLIDDVGRHNALDKVIGKGLMAGADFSRSIIVSTGRTSSEILYKAKRCSVPIILSRGAPTHQSVLLASEMNLTVIGFARGGGYTIYSAAGRIVLN